MTAGRPTKYSDAYPSELIDHMSQGFSFASFSGVIGVTRETIYEWTRVHPEFSDALKIGRAKGMALWEERLAKQASLSGGNTAAIIFAMKNLYQDDWSDRQQTEISGRDGGPIALERVTWNIVDAASSPAEDS